MKGYKGFDPDFKCNNKQYAENTEYEEKGGAICGAGVMHFCETPLDVLDYYPVLNDNCKFNRFAEVTALADVQAEGNKRATKKIKIGAEFSLRDFIKAAVSVCIERTGQDAKASGNSSQLAASGNSSKLAASGDSSKLAASGYYSKLAASGDSSKLAASGDSSKLAASGNSSQLAASGDSSQLAASGYYSKLAASGNSSQLAASGNSSQLAASGDSSKLAASGYYSKLAASGDSSKLAASGDSSKLAASGNYSVVAGIGINNIVKCALGGFIVLAEWVYESGRFIPINVKAAKVDGETIKPDTWYRLVKGEFVEVENA